MRAFAIIHNGFGTESVIVMENVSDYNWKKIIGVEGEIPACPGIHYKQGTGRRYASVYVEDKNGRVFFGGNRNCQSMSFASAVAAAADDLL
jgi:hypothetical protein